MEEPDELARRIGELAAELLAQRRFLCLALGFIDQRLPGALEEIEDFMATHDNPMGGPAGWDPARMRTMLAEASDWSRVASR